MPGEANLMEGLGEEIWHVTASSARSAAEPERSGFLSLASIAGSINAMILTIWKRAKCAAEKE